MKGTLVRFCRGLWGAVARGCSAGVAVPSAVAVPRSQPEELVVLLQR